MKPALAFAALLALAACQKTTQPPQPPANPQPAASAPDPGAANPSKLQKMICRNSQTGAKAECGAPNAVMVGMEPQK